MKGESVTSRIRKNIRNCPRCSTHMKKGGSLKTGPRGGQRRVYHCPKCKYKTVLNENLSAKEVQKIVKKK